MRWLKCISEHNFDESYRNIIGLATYNDTAHNLPFLWSVNAELTKKKLVARIIKTHSDTINAPDIV